MKKLAYILALAAMLTACVAEQIEHPTEAQAPETASAFTPVITVDQATNQVTFSLGQKAYVPVWVFQDDKGEWTEYHTGDGFKKIFASAGQFGVRMFVMNAAGVSPDFVGKEFTIDNTLFDFTRYIRYISGGSEKVWRIDNAAPGHMGCGESVANPTGWWNAEPDAKADFGVYDNRMTFGADGAYTFDPGESGTVYVNKDVTVSKYTAYKGTSTEDYTAPAEKAAFKYEFAVAGNDILLKLDNGALFPYIPNDDFVSETQFRLISLDNNAMTLVTWNGGIAWQFILSSKAAATTFSGFNYNADSNLWKGADADGGLTVSYYYAPGWAQIADPAMEHSGNKYSWILPSATSDRWQAQVFMVPTSNIGLSASKTYDFSCILSSSADLTAKVKLHRMDENGSDADNAAALVDADVPLKAGEDVVFYLTDLPGVDAGNIRLVLDFGGCPDNTEVSISRIVLKDHAVDDGTVLPEEKPDGPDEPETGAHFDITGATNLWRSATIEEMFYYYAPGWAQIDNPGFKADGWKYTISLPQATTDQWQAQVAFRTNMSSVAGKKYDFCCTLISTEDMPGVTIKLVKTGDDGVFYCQDRHKIQAGVPYVYKLPNVDGIDMEKISLFFDFGGCPAGSEVEIYDICFQEHQEPQGNGQGGGLIEGENLWAGATAEMTYWYSASDWQGSLQPAKADVLEGNGLRVIMPEGIGGSEWMGQNAFHMPGITASKDETYDFWMTLEADEDMTVTVKLAWNGHDTTNEFFYDNNVQLKAGEPKKYVQAAIITDPKAEERNDYDGIVLFVDTGRSPAGSEIKMTDIHFQKHIGGSEPDKPEEPEEDFTTNDPSIPADYYDVEGSGNLWRGASFTNTYWYSASDWQGGLEPIVFKADDWGGLKVIIPEGVGGNEWMGQTIWHTDIPASADAKYDFCVTVKSDEDINDLTFKLAWEGHDNDHAMFYVNNAKIKAGVTYTFKMKDLAPAVDYDKVVLFIDCGRCKVGTAVSFTNFCLQKQGGAESFSENLWTEPEITTWFSGADWGGGITPAYTYKDGAFQLEVPAGVGGSEWQGQVKMTIPVAVSAAKKYDFSCKLTADANVTVTVKLADANADAAHAFFYDGNVALAADTPLSYKQSPTVPDQDYSATMLIFDFGRCPVGTLVKATDFVLREIL